MHRMTDAQLIAEAINRNTEALLRMSKRLDYVADLYEAGLSDNANWPQAVGDIIKAIESLKKP